MQIAKRLLVTTLLLPWAPFWFPLNTEESGTIVGTSMDNSLRLQQRSAFRLKPTVPISMILDDASPSLDFAVAAVPKRSQVAPPKLPRTAVPHGMLRGLHNGSRSSNVYGRLTHAHPRLVNDTIVAMHKPTTTWESNDERWEPDELFDSTFNEPDDNGNHGLRRRLNNISENIDWERKYFGSKLKNWIYAGACIVVTLATCCNIVALCCICFSPHNARHKRGGENEDTSTIETIASDGGGPDIEAPIQTRLETLLEEK